MLTDNMPLKKMLDFMPSDLDMAMLALDVVVYLKVCVVSDSNITNYNFLRYLFSNEELTTYFKDPNKTLFYDFDATHTDQAKFITIFEMYSLYNYDNVSAFMQEILENYSHEADVLIDFFTHDSKKYRLSNLDGIVKLEQMNTEAA